MLTYLGLKRVKREIIRFALKDDKKLNAILQEAVKGLNQLIEERKAG